jgi:hypothetical protein
MIEVALFGDLAVSGTAALLADHAAYRKLDGDPPDVRGVCDRTQCRSRRLAHRFLGGLRWRSSCGAPSL